MRQIVLGAVERQDWQKVDEAARNLWQCTYWRSFHHLEHLKGWLLTNHHCAYCNTYLPDTHVKNGRAHTDHLLPHYKYPELKDDCMLNAVAACDECNARKNGWDPNGVDPIYTCGEALSYVVRLALIERTKVWLKDKPLRKRNHRDEKYVADCRAAAEQAEKSLA